MLAMECCVQSAALHTHGCLIAVQYRSCSSWPICPSDSFKSCPRCQVLAAAAKVCAGPVHQSGRDVLGPAFLPVLPFPLCWAAIILRSCPHFRVVICDLLLLSSSFPPSLGQYNSNFSGWYLPNGVLSRLWGACVTLRNKVWSSKHCRDKST